MRRIILSDDQINEVVELYNSGLSYLKIQKITGIDANKVKRTLLELNIPMRKHKKDNEIRRGFTNEEIEAIIKMYLDGAGLTTITKIFNCSPIPTRRMLKENGINLRNAEEAHEYHKMAINENYFDEIDNQDKAYILGFLFADGSNIVRSNAKPTYDIRLTLKVDDKYILERMREKMGIERKVKVITRKSDSRQYAILDIKNKHMSLMLEELGVVQNKTFITQFPNYLRDDLIPHFIRGLMDGDGCISRDLKTVQFAGSHDMMCGLVRQFENFLGFTAHIVNIKHSPGISTVALARKEYKLKYLHWIYDDADLKLERKYKLGMQIIEKYNDEIGLAI